MWFPCVLLLLVKGSATGSVSRFTNIECEMLDPSYATFKQCNLKLLGRGIVGLNVYAKLNKGPFNNAKVNLSLWRKFNGYRPFMFNNTFDYCKLMAESKQKLSFQKMVFETLSKVSNLNHSCPYNHDIIVRDMIFLEEHYRYMPLPSGQYKIQLMAATNNDWKTNINVHFSRNEDLLNN